MRKAELTDVRFFALSVVSPSKGWLGKQRNTQRQNNSIVAMGDSFLAIYCGLDTLRGMAIQSLQRSTKWPEIPEALARLRVSLCFPTGG
jgi:hypothetical protein